MATKSEVRNRALQALGVIAIGATPQAQDATRVDAGFDEIYADIKNEGLAIWASTAAMPNEIVPHMVALVAWNCVDDYGVSPARYQRLQIAQAAAMPKIRALVVPAYESMENATDY